MHIAALMTPVLAVGTAQPAPGGGSMLYPMGTMLLLLAIMYFLMLRPQQVKAKEHRDMISRLKVGDRVITTGGIYGQVAGVDDASLMLKVADGVEVKVIRSAVSTVLSEAANESGKTAKKT